MTESHYLSSTYIKLLIQAHQAYIEDIEERLGQPLMPLIQKPFVEGDLVERMFTFFQRQGLDSWVVNNNQQLGISSHGPLGFAVLTAPDLETAIQVVADYSVIRTSYYDCEFKHVNNRAEYYFVTKATSPLASQWMIESGVYVVKQLIETIVAHPLGNNARIYFQSSEPVYKKDLEELYGVTCEFDQEVNMVSVPSSWCEISSPLSEPETFKSNLQKCIELKQKILGLQDSVYMTRKALSDYFDELYLNPDQELPMPTLVSLAESNNMTSRTFARHLRKSNFTYRAVLSEVRKEQATKLLVSTHFSISDISGFLGYQEPANFIRAFKAWYNCTPTQWRGRNS